ncbi:GNAT family N-acetyltransferase [Mucilaginibacter sp. McL0603]|uniref:GNAT family N-acetyltransferase n=1 Tax=Mucilaginibacter sp. McL0603 TaxID=3415670 RepID=UPI003CEE6A5F
MNRAKTITIKRTDSNDLDFPQLVALLNQELRERYGGQESIYDSYDQISNLDTVVMGYINDLSIGCGCFKKYDDTTVEIKRMFVKPDERRQGIGSNILSELEIWAKEKGFLYAVLETANKQHESIALYKKAGFSIIPNYGQYVGKEISVCMKKKL